MAKKQLSGKVSDGNYDLILELKERKEFTSLGDAMDLVIDHYRATSGKPLPAGKPSTKDQGEKVPALLDRNLKEKLAEDDTYFFVPIKKMDQPKIQEMRNDLYEADALEDPQILKYFSIIHGKLKTGDIVLVNLPAIVKAKLEKASKKHIDSGKVKNASTYLTQFLLNRL